MHIDDLITPALLVDLDQMEANLERMAAYFRVGNCRLRPHFKNHKCIALAELQISRGAIGISVATLKEAEALVNAGVGPVLIANEIAGDSELRRLVELSGEADITVAVDNVRTVNTIARLCAGKSSQPGLVVDLDLGLSRCGVPPGAPVLSLARHILALGLPFRGLMGYEGHLQRLPPSAESDSARRKALEQLVDTRTLLFENDIVCEIVSAGGTGSYAVAGRLEGITEVQSGNYLLMDTSYGPFAPDFKPSLSLLTRVISHTAGERLIINAGLKEISAERGLPTVQNKPGLTLSALHAEHGIVNMSGLFPDLCVGSAICLDVFYSDATVNLHRVMFGVRRSIVQQIFEII